MVQWGSCGRAILVDQHEGSNFRVPSSIIKEEQGNDEETTRPSSPVLAKLRKRKRKDADQPKKARDANCTNQIQFSIDKQIKRENSDPSIKAKSICSKKQNRVDRWSIDRYKLAEKHMFEVMKAEGAAFDNPISRLKLRVAARQYIGDTGLLDHLLKHVDGKLTPGGTERFRRCHNTEGIMEYWLESADLVKIKREAGVPDPTWIPPSGWMHNGVAIRESAASLELKLLKDELAKLKRGMDELSSKKQEQNRVNPVEEMHKELMRWRNKTDERLMEISSSLSGMQDMCRELMTWKSKAEQQLTEIANSVNSLQAPRQCTTFSPVGERWEDWLENTNLDNIQEEDLAPWLGSTDLVNVVQNAAVQECLAPEPWLKHCDSPSQEPGCARELGLLKEEMEKMRRDVQDLLPKRVEDAQASVTPDSSTTNNSKCDLDNPFVLFQEMFKEMVKWKAKMEEQMVEVVNSVNAMQAKQIY
ncbi:protein DYAD isoform X2 [Mercurialis annua]|nr:protein DYAD isoform X2 [Mercurialis annua]XP_055962494.1 protein DYAD isoform X2 [Mercurialis annua]